MAEQAGGTGAIVIRAVVDVVAVGQRRAQTDVIQVRADDHVLVLQHRIAAFEDADHVFAVAGSLCTATCRLSFLSAFSSKESMLARCAPRRRKSATRSFSRPGKSRWSSQCRR